MRAELAAIRNLTGLQHKGRVQVPKLEGFSRAESQLITEMAERSLHEVFVFCLTKKFDSSNSKFPVGVHKQQPFTSERLQVAFRRFVAIAWLLHSEMLIGTERDDHGESIPLSLAQLGKLPQLDCTKVALSLCAKRFAQQFNFQSRVQKRKGSKPNYAASAKTGWAKRRARIAQRTRRRRK